MSSLWDDNLVLTWAIKGTHLKGILFRISLVGCLPISILCLWELTEGDSPAEMVLAVGFFLGVMVSLAWASWNVIRLARRSVSPLLSIYCLLSVALS